MKLLNIGFVQGRREFGANDDDGIVVMAAGKIRNKALQTDHMLQIQVALEKNLWMRWSRTTKAAPARIRNTAWVRGCSLFELQLFLSARQTALTAVCNWKPRRAKRFVSSI